MPARPRALAWSAIAVATDGTGLQGMADRLAALSGKLLVESAPGHGTTVSGRLPVRESERV